MRVTAVVVAWNSAVDLPACLDALLSQDHRPLQVVVVDNASRDATGDLLGRYLDGSDGDRIRVVRNRTNRGFAGGVNDGVAAADGADAVLVCNPDVVARPDHVRRLVAALAAAPARGAVQGKLLRRGVTVAGRPAIDSTGHVAYRTRLFRNRGEGEPDDGRWDRPGEVFGVTGALALYRRAMLDDVALRRPDGRREVFDEDLFAYFEDVDLDWRARLRGWVAWYEPAAVALHQRGGAGPRRTATVEALNWRNRLLVVVKCDDAAALARALPGVAVTTLLKTAELALTDPRALARGWRDLRRLLPRARATRREVRRRATTPSAEVVARWFARFHYRPWIRAWWRRVSRRRSAAGRAA